jgi:Uma2 family endonuclease
MTIPVQLVTVTEFLRQVEADPDTRLELIDGVIYKVTSNQKSSSAGAWIIAALGIYFGDTDPGDITGADGGYTFGGDYFVPDVAFVARERQPEQPDVTYNPIVPDFAVEAISPSDLEHPTERIDKKLKKYQAAKIPLLWLVFPSRQEIAVYAHGKYVRTAGIDDTLDGGDVLPGFTLAVKRIFRK